MIIFQHAAEAFSTCDLADRCADTVVRINDLVVKPLMISFCMIMLMVGHNVPGDGWTPHDVASQKLRK